MVGNRRSFRHRDGIDLNGPAPFSYRNHFWMKQSLQGPFFRSVKVGLWKRSRNDSGKKMVLVRKTDWSGTQRLRYFGKTSPLDVRGNIGQPDLLERRR